METKQCTKCHMVLPATTDNFYSHARTGLYSQCKACARGASRQWSQAHKQPPTDTKLAYWRERYQRQKAERETLQESDVLETLSDLDCAYLAGLVDGEGCLSIVKNTRDIHVPQLQIRMTAEPVLQWVAAHTGTICSPNKRKSHPNHQQLFEVRLTGRRAIWLVMRIEPYMRVKRDEALVLIEYGETYRTGYDSTGVPQDVIDHRDALKLKMHRLKGRASAFNRTNED